MGAIVRRGKLWGQLWGATLGGQLWEAGVTLEQLSTASLNSSFKDLQLWRLALEYNFEEQLWEQLSLWWGAASGNRFETEPVWGNRFAEILWARALGRTSLGSSFAALITFPEQLRSFGEQLWAGFPDCGFSQVLVEACSPAHQNRSPKLLHSCSPKPLPKVVVKSCFEQLPEFCKAIPESCSDSAESCSPKLFIKPPRKLQH